MRRTSMAVVLTALIACLSIAAYGAGLASDSAADTAYDDGWQTGDNGGSGFNAWFLSPNVGTSNFVASSTTNGDGDGNADGDIDSPRGEGRAWGLRTDPAGNFAEGFRTFNGNLTPGNTFVIEFDNGFIEGGASTGVGLQEQFGSGERWQLFFSGGSGNYTLIDGDNPAGLDTGISFTDEGLRLEFTLTGADTYSANVYQLGLGGISKNFSGNLRFTGENVNELRAFSFGNAGGAGTPANDTFVNNMQIIPEPTSLAFFGAALLGIAVWRRRR